MNEVPLLGYCRLLIPWSQNFQQISSHHGETTNTYYNICPYLRDLYEFAISPSPNQNIHSVKNNFNKTSTSNNLMQQNN